MQLVLDVLTVCVNLLYHCLLVVRVFEQCLSVSFAVHCSAQSASRVAGYGTCDNRSHCSCHSAEVLADRLKDRCRDINGLDGGTLSAWLDLWGAFATAAASGVRGALLFGMNAICRR